MPRQTPPITLGKTFEPLEHPIGQDHERVMKSTGPAAEALEPLRFEGVDRPVDTEKAAMLEFLEQPVEVQIHVTMDAAAEQVFEISVNGRPEFFRRGEKKTCKRKFVEGMARSKLTTYVQERRRGDDGVMYDVQVPKTGLRYPFSVTSDPHPRGADWLESVLAQG